ncbi:MAG: hypothetical protein KAI47_02810 [Deltaproteobacteria bacterium]|nr:hypothetical protein [Deltaproteobacteria bacterium]
MRCLSKVFFLGVGLVLGGGCAKKNAAEPVPPGAKAGAVAKKTAKAVSKKTPVATPAGKTSPAGATSSAAPGTDAVLKTLVLRKAQVKGVAFTIKAPKAWKQSSLSALTEKWVNVAPRDYLGRVDVSWRPKSMFDPQKIIGMTKGLPGFALLRSEKKGKMTLATFAQRAGGFVKRVKTLTWLEVDAKTYLACEALYSRYPKMRDPKVASAFVNAKAAQALTEAMCHSLSSATSAKAH